MEIDWSQYILDRDGCQPVVWHETCGPVSETIVYNLREAIEWAKEHEETGC